MQTDAPTTAMLSNGVTIEVGEEEESGYDFANRK